MRNLSLLLAFSCLFTFTSCDSGPEEPDIPTIEETTFADALDVDLEAMTKTSTGLYYRDLEEGSGDEVTTGQAVATRYTGWLTDGTKFDERDTDDTPFSFTVGQGRVIPGWDQGVLGMRVGGRRQLIIPPALGYGARANGPIPPYSILVFVVHVVSTPSSYS